MAEADEAVADGRGLLLAVRHVASFPVDDR